MEENMQEKKSSWKLVLGIVLGIILLLGLGLIGGGYLVYSKVIQPVMDDVNRSGRLAKEGKLATARIVDVQSSGLDTRDHSGLELILQVQPKGEKPFQVSMTRAVSRTSLSTYRKGAIVQVRYDPQNPHDIVMVSSPQTVEDTARSVPFR
jgi:hypothetical protein